MSDRRVASLVETVGYLKQYVRVHLVRLPVHPEMMAIETTFMPEFNRLIQDVAQTADVPYLDLTLLNHQFAYTDGNYLYKTSGAEVSRLVGQWMLIHRP